MTIDTEKLRELAQECIKEDNFVILSPQALLALLDELDRLRDAIKKQASSAIMGIDAAKSAGFQMMGSAWKLHAECKPEVVESERSANAFLTEESASTKPSSSSPMPPKELNK